MKTVPIADLFQTCSEDTARPWQERVSFTVLVLLGARVGLWPLPAAYLVPATALLTQTPSPSV